MHPLFLVLAVVSIITCMYALYGLWPILMPIAFAASAVALAVRIHSVARERRRRADSTIDVDYARLRHTNLSRLLPWLKQNLRGHDAVVDRVAAKVQQRLAIASPTSTLGAFLLVGPTGTGKTFLGEMVAKALYPESEPLVLRMNQYKDHQDVFTLLGPPPGYSGFEVGGSITRPVLKNPYRVIIFDEFDKSHPDVQHCLYDILDKAQCQEKSSGKVVHFNACAFFATCNAGTESLRAIWRETNDPLSAAGRVRDALSREGFDKPLLARFDEILLMDQLKPLDIAEIACLQISKHWRQYGIEVFYASPEVLVETMRRNLEFKDYGVRQLARLVQEMTNPAIEEAWRAGASQIRLDMDQDTGRLLVQKA